ncbi:MAG: DSD1 family PLP-dependent enzyme [Steroidobacteraceae bacterium]
MKQSSRGTLRHHQNLGPNAPLIGKPRSRQALATPALILDLDGFEHNLAAMSALCKRAGLKLRPHAKTHKSVEIARRQIGAGAVGISVATLREATVMVEAGIPGVLLTTPLTGAVKIDLLARLVGRSDGFMAAIDDPAGLAPLERALERRRRKLPVLVDIDIGMKRTGVPDVAGALELIRRVSSSRRLQFAGIQCYSGMVQHITRAADRARVYGRQLEHVKRVLKAAAKAGHPAGIVSGGGTGTFDIDRRAGLFTECQCGSYAVMDVEYQDVELFARQPHPFTTALFVQCSVVSNHHRRLPTIDGGFKCFSMDGPIPEIASGAPRGASYQFYGDEFGKIKLAAKSAGMRLGAKVELVTPHCDPTINLHDFIHCVRGQTLVDIWPVDARGSL